MRASKKSLRTLDMTYISLFTVLMAVCAWIAVPAPVSFTLQTFAVFFALLTLGGRRGTLCIVTYLMMGAVGLPVFTGFQGGAGTLMGATGGYLLGFLATAVIFRLVTAPSPRSVPLQIIGCLTGLAGCYAFGTAWYVLLYGGSGSLWSALTVCVLPFLIPDLIKLALAVVLSERLKRHLH